MKSTIAAATLASLLSTTAMAQETVGVSMALFDDNFLTVLRNGMIDHAGSMDGVDIQIEDAQNDVGRQLNQIQNFVASGVDAIIVNPVDTDATQAMTNAAEQGGVPLVFVNRVPVNLDELPQDQAFVGSDEKQSGTLQTEEVCRLLQEQGVEEANILVLVGELQTQAARMRTQDIKDVIATDECSFMTIVGEQTANFIRTEGQDVMTNWLSAGIDFDAVISNNDEMAIGAIQAMKSAGMSMDEVIVAGIDATQDGLQAMRAGDLDVTVFQNAQGQGETAVNTAVALARDEGADTVNWVPFELVTPENMDQYTQSN